MGAFPITVIGVLKVDDSDGEQKVIMEPHPSISWRGFKAVIWDSLYVFVAITDQ